MNAPRLSVTQAAERAACNVSYIRAEIYAERLPATKNATGGWEIEPSDFAAWMANPRRGSRRNK